MVTFEKNFLTIRIPSQDAKYDWAQLLSGLALTLELATYTQIKSDRLCTAKVCNLIAAMVLDEETQIKD